MDNLPTASPDGKYLAWFAMKRPGYEADRQVLMVRDLASGQVRALTESWDRSVGSIAWSTDSKTIYVTAEDTQEVPIFAIDLKSGKPTRLTQEGSVSAVVPTAKGLVYAMNSLTAPDDFYWLAGKKSARLTSVNADKFAGIDMIFGVMWRWSPSSQYSLPPGARYFDTMHVIPLVVSQSQISVPSRVMNTF